MIILTILGIILKITAVILIVAWLFFMEWSFKNTKSWAEKRSMQRWFIVVAFLGVFGIYTQWIMFIPAWIFRYSDNRYFSWWLDDSRFGNYNGSPWSEDYYQHLDGRAETFWIAYLWHLRNMIWNLQAKDIFRVLPQNISIGNQNIIIKRVITDTITNLVLNTQTAKYKKLDISGIFGQFAGLKYFKNGQGGWQNMNGDEISSKHSVIGTGFYFYKNADMKGKNQLNFTFTQTKLVKTWIGGMRWRTIQIGSKQTGYSRQFKYQKSKEVR